MKTTITAYLNFNGNCREAMNFYRDCLGGDLAIQSIAEGPMAEHFPAEARNNVMHAQLTRSDLTLMGSDMSGPEGITQGNSMSLMLSAESYAQANEFFDKLSDGANVDHPMQDAFWGGIFGHLTDKFGVIWMVHAGQE